MFGQERALRYRSSSRRSGAIMPGHLQDGFGCVVTNRFDQLLDDESDPFEVLRAAESRRKEAAGPAGKGGAQPGQPGPPARGPRKEPPGPGRDRRNPPERREDPQPPAAPKKEGGYGAGTRSEH